MKRYEYSVIREISSGDTISWKCSTRESARNHKRSLKEAGIPAKIVQTVYQQVSCQEVR
ncbi:hypothetical protein D3C85_1002040 [compost metagenome]